MSEASVSSTAVPHVGAHANGTNGADGVDSAKVVSASSSSLSGQRTSSDKGVPKTKTTEHITVLGAGSFGTAIGCMFARNGHHVVVLDRSAERVESINTKHVNPDYLSNVRLPPTFTATTDPDVAFTHSTYVFHAVPIQASRDYLAQFKDKIKPTVPIISMSKGIHCGTLQFMNDIIAEVFGPDHPSAYLSGPSFAKEIADRQPTGLVVASTSKELAERIASTIDDDDRIRVYTSSDVVGVEVGGALKNIYAIGAGIVEGAGFGYNPTALLVTRGCSEIKKLAVALGAHPETLSGLSGIGDLMLTCFGPASRNRSVGVRIGKGEKLDDVLNSLSEVAEGIPTILAARNLAEKLGLLHKLPLLKAIHHTVYEGIPIQEALRELMDLPVQEED